MGNSLRRPKKPKPENLEETFENMLLRDFLQHEGGKHTRPPKWLQFKGISRDIQLAAEEWLKLLHYNSASGGEKFMDLCRCNHAMWRSVHRLAFAYKTSTEWERQQRDTRRTVKERSIQLDSQQDVEFWKRAWIQSPDMSWHVGNLLSIIVNYYRDLKKRIEKAKKKRRKPQVDRDLLENYPSDEFLIIPLSIVYHSLGEFYMVNMSKFRQQLLVVRWPETILWDQFSFIAYTLMIESYSGRLPEAFITKAVDELDVSITLRKFQNRIFRILGRRGSGRLNDPSLLKIKPSPFPEIDAVFGNAGSIMDFYRF